MLYFIMNKKQIYMKLKNYLLTGLLLTTTSLTSFASSKIQIIHNSADPAAAVVDIYLGAALIADDFAFRTASAFLDVPSGVELVVSIAPSTSTSVADAIAAFTYTLADGENYVAVANGVLNPADFAANPDGEVIAFNILVKSGIELTAAVGSNVDFVVLHGATDAPSVSVYARGVAQIVPTASYTDFTDYISVPAGSYIVDITPAGAVIPVVAAFTADLSTLAGGTAVVLASGFLNPAANLDGEAFALLAVLTDGTVITLPAAATATLQVIHNSADPAAEVVDVYVGGVLTVDNFGFRTATGTLTIPSDVVVSIAVAPGTSTSVADALATFDITFADNQNYVAIANGVLNPMDFAVNPDGASTAFTLFSTDNIRLTAVDPTKVEFIAVHGASDAPTVDVRVGGAALVDDASYGDITGYVAVDPGTYVLDITTADGATTVVSYTAPLDGLAGGTAVVFASGFLNPAANNDGAPFGLFAALGDGTVVEFANFVSINDNTTLVGVAVYPNPTSNTLILNNENNSNYFASIFNMNGQMVKSVNVAGGNTTVDITNLSAGMYTILITDGVSNYTTNLSVVK